MALPKHKVSKQKGNSRFAHWTIKKINLVECPQCKELKRPHEVCPKCGYYDGKPVVVVEEAKK
jgi:large subunit ribosomal protein L32